LLAIEILKKALEYRPRIQKAILGNELQALPPDEKANEWFSPRVAIHGDQSHRLYEYTTIQLFERGAGT
jgi:hypothetical protein